MSGEKLIKRVYASEVNGRRNSGRLCMRWLDSVRNADNAK